MRGPFGCLGGCLVKLVLFAVAACVFVWILIVALHPWALHIGGRSTPLLTWHGVGSVVSKDGKSYPLYISFTPGRSRGTHVGGGREGKRKIGALDGRGWLCIAPGNAERMNVSGTIYGSYTSTEESLIAFRLLEWRRPFAFNPPKRGFFDLAGTFQGPDLVMDRTGEQGIPFASGLFIDHATVTLRWGSYDDFEAACRNMARANGADR
jgi:hypothetical protein